uniref:Putative lipoprotein MPN_097 n=1 Tax=Anthurium amnicola TaxID=1678845 RepID=A0A1D1Y4C9_9ARAE
MASFPPPAVVYPRSNPTGPHPSHSRGSFGPVFIVLAVITVLAAIACFLGRACARRYSQAQPRGRQGRTFAKGDLEDRFEMSIPAAKSATNGVIKEGKPSESSATKSQAKPNQQKMGESSQMHK